MRGGGEARAFLSFKGCRRLPVKDADNGLQGVTF